MPKEFPNISNLFKDNLYYVLLENSHITKKQT